MHNSLIFNLIILILGDSHGAGTPGKELQKLFNQRQNTIVFNKSKGGTTVIHWVRKPIKLLPKADLVIFFLGTNDNPSYSQKYYKTLKEKYKDAIIVSPPLFPERVKRRGERIPLNTQMAKMRRIQREVFGINWIDSVNECDLGLDYRMRDGVHLLGKSAKKWAKCIYKSIQIEGF